MCRLYGFRSSVLSGVHASLVAAENALAQQSALHPDGWGLAYYNSRFPQLLRNDEKALDDRLFKEISAVAVLDVSGDGIVSVSDVVHLSSFLFQGGSPPAQGVSCFAVGAALGCAANMGCQ